MAYVQNPEDKRNKRRQVSFNQTLDKILSRAACRARTQHATFLLEIIEWGVENGAIESLLKDEKKSSAA
ncbi:hypothetical protein L6218_06175 [Pseudomonas syringae pv. syringae]|uniref:Uncharacterized protein n=6 Tax=root TaxID=1 RepID=A0A0N8T2T9_9PSED|nr:MULTISPECIES: hypothetical protein [Pseudomonas syringae group]YP_010773170.1 putative HTH-type transcriptional regulator [Pseudomonas phage MR15]QJD55119.1 putative HTH-type transcriptional regulator [Pseudomonas phage MR13]QXV71622.1 hypothetical protein psageB2_045 [Pseudomonas phage psageB2]AXH56290.1 hypothetical protein PLA107_013950 [Pseudomonas amygdali pv. lachrymans str. M301315]KPB77941.1 Uncharacterized protein AC507_1650 [Pseudomonas syringae pv. maculicola]KPB95723.1 Uncharac